MALHSPRWRGSRSPHASVDVVGMAKYTLDKGLRRPVSLGSMSTSEPDRTRLLRRLAAGGAGLAFGLIVLGGVVRITGSGMGCGDHWPRCTGAWFPPLDLPTLIEIGHRWAAALVSILVLAVAAAAWRRHRTERALVRPAVLAGAVLVAQVLLGAVTVKLELPPWVIITHLANAMVLLAILIVVALRATPESATRPPLARSERRAVPTNNVAPAAVTTSSGSARTLRAPSFRSRAVPATIAARGSAKMGCAPAATSAEAASTTTIAAAAAAIQAPVCARAPKTSAVRRKIVVAEAASRASARSLAAPRTATTNARWAVRSARVAV